MKKYIKKIFDLLAISYSMSKKHGTSVAFFLKGKTDDIKSSTSSSVHLIPSVLRKPSVLWRWLFCSYWFYLSLILSFILINTVVDTAVDKSLAKLYPPIKTKQLFGLVVQEQDDPRIAWQRTLIRGAFKIAGYGVCAYVLLLSLPGIVRKTTRKANNTEAMADRIITEKPTESILLYNRALKLVVDESHESILKSKIDTMDNSLKSINIERSLSGPPASSEQKDGGTVIISKDDLSAQVKSEDVIGSDGRYRIVKKLGQGAMGIVFLGKDQLLLREVALKKLSACHSQDSKLVTRLQQEARALAQLNHQNIVQVYDFIQEGSEYWIAMEYVDGRDLEIILNERGKFTTGEAAQICCMVSEAMEYAHSRGVVHRDFKPSNVLMTADGGLKVMDFGLAKLAQSSAATMEGSLIGSPAFMSPEQAMGKEADNRSDIYSLGATLYQLVTGILPYTGDLKSVITQKISGRRPFLEDLEDQMPSEMAQLISKMTATDPNERPNTMKEVYAALKRSIQELSQPLPQ